MMKLFSLYDVKACAFSAPMCIQTRGLALRTFSEVLSSNGPVAQYPEDYNLYELGEFDPDTGAVKPMVPVQMVCTGIAMKQQLIEARKVREEEQKKS